MKIVAVDVFPLAHTMDVPRGDARGISRRRQTTLVRVTSDEGAAGWGQGGSAETIRRRLAPIVVGQDPRESGRLWRQMARAAARELRSVGAVDVALWDLRGKLAGLSVAQLLGGALRDRVPAYASLHNYSPSPALDDELTQTIRAARAAGFGALKLRVGGRSLPEDVRYARLAREVAGPHMQLMADANRTYTVPAALRMGRVLEELDFFWYEEPIEPFDQAGYLRLCAGLDIAIAGGEGINTPEGIAPVLSRRALDIYQPDVGGAGGLTAIPTLMAMSAAFGVPATAHCWDQALVQVAALHLLATVPTWTEGMAASAPRLEVTADPRQPLNYELLTDAPAVGVDGAVPVPTAPGLGVEPNPDVLARYAAPPEGA